MRTNARGMALAVGVVSALGLGPVAIGLGVTGCGSSRQAAWDRPQSAAQAAKTAGGAERRTAVLAEADAHWAKRVTESELRAAIRGYGEASQIDPNDHVGLVKLARAQYLLADGFLALAGDAKREEMLRTYEAGISSAERAMLAVSPEFRRLVTAGARAEEVMDRLGREAVPAIYWRATNLGKWANAQGFATILEHKEEIKAMMNRCLALDENYFFAAPHRYFGAFYARAPDFAGGDLEKSAYHFRISLERAPNYFATRVLRAEFLATKRQDRTLYQEDLNWVLSHDPAAEPEVEPENRLEQQKARKLLNEINERFE